MQEKVTFTPPEIKIFEGKTPPTSWFNENIVRYFHIQGQTEFLQMFHSYLRQLQSEQIAKAIPHAVEAEPEFVSIPEEAGSQDVSNALTYNALQPAIKTEIEFLEKLIVLLQKSNPGLVKDLDNDLTQLKLIAKGFPSFTQENVTFLKKIMNKLDEYAKNMPLAAQRKYFENQFSMLYQLWEQVDGSLKKSNEEMNGLSKKITSSQDLEKALEQMTALFQAKRGQSLTSEDLQQLMNFLENIADSHSTLSSTQQKAIQSYLSKLGQVQSKTGMPLSSLTSNALLSKWIQGILQRNPNASQEDIKAAIGNLLDESHLQTTDLPFLKDIGSSIKDLIDDASFPFSSGNLGATFASEQDGKVTANTNFTNEIGSKFALEENSVKGVVNEKNTLSEALRTGVQNYQTRQQGYESSYGARSSVKGALGASAAGAAGSSYGSGSLPNEFRNAILGHYMPGQEAYLMQLAELLYFDNFGAEMGNMLLDKVMDFGLAASNYSFANFLHKDGNVYSGSYSQAKAQLSGEVRQASTDMNKIKSALLYILHEIKSIQDNPRLSSSQKKQLIGNLQKYSLNLGVAYSQLENLHSVLINLKVEPVQGNPNQFTISGDTTNLAADEHTVTNGDPNNDPPGGLVNIQSMITADQQNYSDLGQNQQMILQMRMTEIQQEWTVVSDSLQALNQMYMTCAQAIYK